MHAAGQCLLRKTKVVGDKLRAWYNILRACEGIGETAVAHRGIGGCMT